jgi:hypothetical protein
MVRRGSTVRVRQRALQKRRTSALFCSARLAPGRTCDGHGAVYGAFRFEGLAVHVPPEAKCPAGGKVPAAGACVFGVELWSTGYQQTEPLPGWFACEQATCAPCCRRSAPLEARSGGPRAPSRFGRRSPSRGTAGRPLEHAPRRVGRASRGPPPSRPPGARAPGRGRRAGTSDSRTARAARGERPRAGCVARRRRAGR